MDVAKDMIENPDMLLRFEGHACAIGSTSVNERLSKQRAESFTQAFLSRVLKTYPNYYADIKKRVAPPIGFGEREPFKVRLRGGAEITLGDNQTPTGRYLNRRIAVLLYREH